MNNHIRIPEKLICLKGGRYQLYLYIYLQLLKTEDKLHINNREFLSFLKWKDSKTLKKYLILLHNNGYIALKDTNLKFNRDIDVTITDKEDDYYIAVSQDIVHLIREATINGIGNKNKNEDNKELGLQVYCFYELFFKKYKKCTISYDFIRNTIGVSYNYISIINKNLKANNLLKIKVGEKVKNSKKRKVNKYTPINNRADIKMMSMFKELKLDFKNSLDKITLTGVRFKNMAQFNIEDIINLSCVYGIYNKVEDKYYIGGTSDLYTRVINHFYELIKGKHHSYKLQKCFNGLDKNNFEVHILEIVGDLYNRHIQEQKYINLANAVENGYNVMPMAGYNGKLKDYKNETLNQILKNKK